MAYQLNCSSAKNFCGSMIRHTLRLELKYCFVNATSWDKLVKWNRQIIIAVNVNRLIAHNRSTALAGASNTDTKQLWGLLKRTGNWGTNKQTVSNIDSNQISDYFTNIATDPACDRRAAIKAMLPAVHHAVDFVKYTRDSIELILAMIRKTS